MWRFIGRYRLVLACILMTGTFAARYLGVGY